MGTDGNVDEADEDDGRALSAIETSPTVVVGPVGKGIGFAYLSNNLVEDKEAADDDIDGNEIKGQVLSARWNRNQRFVNAVNTGQTAVITFEAVGTMDGGDVRFEMPNLSTNPQNSSSIADGYVSVTTSSGVGIGSMYFPTLNARAVDIPITSMGKGGTISLTYRLTDSQIAVENIMPGYQFRVYTKFGASDTFSQGAGAAGELSATTNTEAKTTAVDGYERSNAIYNDRLVLRVNSVAGTGSAQIVGNSVFRKSVFAGSDSGTAASFASVNLVIRYQADSKVGSIQIKIPTAAGIGGGGIRGWTKPVSPDADANPIGEVASSLGDAVATGGNIIVTNLNMIPGQTIDVTYARASYLYGVNDGTGYVNISGATTLANTVTAGGEETFVVQSSGNAAGGSWADIASSPTVTVISDDGVGKVSTAYLNIDQDQGDADAATIDNVNVTTAADGNGGVDNNGVNGIDETTEVTLAASLPAGEVRTLRFIYNLDDATGTYEYIKNGRLQIVLPSSGIGWSTPKLADGVVDAEGEVSVTVRNKLNNTNTNVTTTANVAVALEDGTDGVDNDNDTKIDESHDLPTLSFPGGQIVVDIPKLRSDASSTASTQALVVEYRTKLPVSKADYSFLVRSKSGASGSPLIMIKNRSVVSANPVTDSQAVVTTAYGSSLSGTTSTTMPTTVAGGSPDQS